MTGSAPTRRLGSSSPDAADASGTSSDEDAPPATEVYTPMGDCEACPRNWRVAIERDDETVKGEHESCAQYGRRRQFEYTVVFQDSDSYEKMARNTIEYRPCRFTEADEVYRFVRMQAICLAVGLWFLRHVLRQRIASASLFDQRRMRIQSAHGGGAATHANKKAIPKRRDSMETVELVPTVGPTPTSLAPDPNLPTV